MPGIRTMVASTALIAAAAGPSLPAGASPHPATTTSRFAGLTTFDAAHSGRAVLRLTRSVPVHMNRDGSRIAGLTFHGDGRIVGVVVTAPDGHIGLAEFRMRTCFTSGCHRSVLGDRDQYMDLTWGGPAQTGPTAPPFRLTPGLYQVSVYTDGSPLRASLRLPGLLGRSAVTMHLPQRSHVESPQEHGMGGTPATPASVQSLADYTLRTDLAVLAMIHRVRGGPHIHSESSWCIYQDAGPPQGVVTPNCAGGSGIVFGPYYVSRSVNMGAWGMSMVIGPAASGYYAQGASETGLQVATDVHDTFFWGDAGMPTQH